MADLQTQFRKFHEAIQLVDMDENAELRQKRDMLLDELRNKLSEKFRGSGKPTPTFEWINQGSYAMGTGVKPVVGEDYDIDIGILFNFSKSDYGPIDAKLLVYEALNAVTKRTVEFMRPCVRVQYSANGRPTYHVDLAVYSNSKSNPTGWGTAPDYLAKGHRHSAKEYQIWEEAEPQKLKDLVQNKFSNSEDRAQFRRVIRYLKRWKDVLPGNSENGVPTGIALTALALDCFNISKNFFGEYNDLNALQTFVGSILWKFTNTYDHQSRQWHYKISTQLPVKPYNDLFDKMSLQQQTKLKGHFETLKAALDQAYSQSNTLEACKVLRKVFGDDFPAS